MSRDHGLASRLQFHFTFERQEGLPAVSDLRQGFLPPKIVQPHVLRLSLSVCDALVGLLNSNKLIIPVFRAIKVISL